MSLYVLSDLHLSIDIDKSMDIFDGWENYTQKIKYNWEQLVNKNDTIVLAGDLCWGKNLKESLSCFKFIDRLPGKKILLKGNHDYWWSTKSKMDQFFLENNLTTLNILHNNHYVFDNICICGTRGWIFENGKENNIKLINRESERLKQSIKSCLHLKLPIIVFLHYPPIYRDQISNSIYAILKQYNIKKCYYGHLHGSSSQTAINGLKDGINYQLVSCDYVNFSPIKIDL